MPYYPDKIVHSKKYFDSTYEYKHVLLPKDVFKTMEKNRIFTEEEVHRMGVINSKGWEHYTIFKNEPYVLLFRRKKKMTN